jgi:hypothetical protein
MQLQAQRGERTARGLAGGEVETERLAVLRGELQPAQCAFADEGRPAQHRAARTGRERLLHGPEPVGAVVHADHEQSGEFDPGAREGGRVRQAGWCDEGDPGVPAREARERRDEQRQLADAGLRHQQLGEGSARPAAAGKQRIERGVACGLARQGDVRARVTTPEAGTQQQGVEQGFGGGHGDGRDLCGRFVTDAGRQRCHPDRRECNLPGRGSADDARPRCDLSRPHGDCMSAVVVNA